MFLGFSHTSSPSVWKPRDKATPPDLNKALFSLFFWRGGGGTLYAQILEGFEPALFFFSVGPAQLAA